MQALAFGVVGEFIDADNNILAAVDIGDLYRDGHGVAQDYAQALDVARNFGITGGEALWRVTLPSALADARQLRSIAAASSGLAGGGTAMARVSAGATCWLMRRSPRCCSR